MTATQIRDVTPLATAEAELAAVDAEVARVERENRPTEEKFGALHETLDTVSQTRGTNAPEARKAAAGIAALSGLVMAGRRRLDAAQRRRATVLERVESEKRAIALARLAVAEQEQRVTRQAGALRAAQRLVAEKAMPLAEEERRLVDLRRDLEALTGGNEVATYDPPRRERRAQ